MPLKFPYGRDANVPNPGHIFKIQTRIRLLKIKFQSESKSEPVRVLKVYNQNQTWQKKKKHLKPGTEPNDSNPKVIISLYQNLKHIIFKTKFLLVYKLKFLYDYITESQFRFRFRSSIFKKKNHT